MKSSNIKTAGIVTKGKGGNDVQNVGILTMKEQLKKRFVFIGQKKNADTQKHSADLEDTKEKQIYCIERKYIGQGGFTPFWKAVKETPGARVETLTSVLFS